MAIVPMPTVMGSYIYSANWLMLARAIIIAFAWSRESEWVELVPIIEDKLVSYAYQVSVGPSRSG